MAPAESHRGEKRMKIEEGACGADELELAVQDEGGGEGMKERGMLSEYVGAESGLYTLRSRRS